MLPARSPDVAKGFSVTPPRLDVYRDEMTVVAGRMLQIQCLGERPLNWTLPYSKVSLVADISFYFLSKASILQNVFCIISKRLLQSLEIYVRIMFKPLFYHNAFGDCIACL